MLAAEAALPVNQQETESPLCPEHATVGREITLFYFIFLSLRDFCFKMLIFFKL